MHLVVQIAGAIAWLGVLAGCLLLYIRLRNIFSASFVLAMVAIAVWAFWGQSALAIFLAPAQAVVNAGQGSNAAEALASMGHSQDVIAAVDSILMGWIGISFFLAIQSIRSQRVA